MTFAYTSKKQDNISIFKLQGELIDKNQAMSLLEEINECIANNEFNILLDLADLKYLNSTGLNVIITILTKARKGGGDVAVCNVSKKVNELLVITKLNQVFNVCSSEKNAIEVFNK
ncbi:MAG: hypothetical protein A3F72_05170 [Bacteroidetes bacterium RIFCSPLOWO2_12_FULL_35_15]|nr:MAG: hypothetical protein A3F72_05170 [Bacteroidetes bacterium RIFCSPLOWO2_12_FULL_35_15]